MLHPSNADELEQIATELGAHVLRPLRYATGCWRNGWLQYPGPNSGDWEIGGRNLVRYGLYHLSFSRSYKEPIA